MRLLARSSDASVTDWWEESQQIDEVMGGFGMDLSEEAVYLLFSNLSELELTIARPVIGPLKELQAPYKIIDWSSAPVHRVPAAHSTWPEVFEQAQAEWEKLQNTKLKYLPQFMIRLERQIDSGLVLKTEILFHE